MFDAVLERAVPTAHASRDDFEWDRPIIIIGTGQSGSTLLSAIIGEHPDVYAAGPNGSLLNRLWREFFANPEFSEKMRIRHLLRNSRREWRDLLWHEFAGGPLRQYLDGQGDATIDEIKRREEIRIARSLGRFIAECLVPPEVRRRFWSFEEIWNGSSSPPCGWRRHDMAFPGARYVQIVRHPWAWAKSYFAGMNLTPSKEDLCSALSNWVSMVEAAYLNEKHSGRYILVKFEDLKANTAATIRAVLSFLELADNPRCHAAAAYEYMPDQVDLSLPALSDKDLDGISKLASLMERIGYGLPAE